MSLLCRAARSGDKELSGNCKHIGSTCVSRRTRNIAPTRFLEADTSGLPTSEFFFLGDENNRFLGENNRFILGEDNRPPEEDLTRSASNGSLFRMVSNSVFCCEPLPTNTIVSNPL